MKNLNANDLLRGRVVLITGSTSGIGLGMAEAFAAEGATLMINGIAAPWSFALSF